MIEPEEAAVITLDSPVAAVLGEPQEGQARKKIAERLGLRDGR